VTDRRTDRQTDRQKMGTYMAGGRRMASFDTQTASDRLSPRSAASELQHSMGKRTEENRRLGSTIISF
jgi:hypothetical protein